MKTKIPALSLQLGLTLFAWLVSAHPALAALPTAVPPSTGAANNNYLDTFKGYAKDAGLVIGLLLAIGALCWIAWHSMADLHEWRTGRKEGGQLVMSVIAGGAVLLMVIFLANQAATVI